MPLFKGVGRTKVLISLDASMGREEGFFGARRGKEKRKNRRRKKQGSGKKTVAVRIFINRFQVTDFG